MNSVTCDLCSRQTDRVFLVPEVQHLNPAPFLCLDCVDKKGYTITPAHRAMTTSDAASIREKYEALQREKRRKQFDEFLASKGAKNQAQSDQPTQEATSMPKNGNGKIGTVKTHYEAHYKGQSVEMDIVEVGGNLAYRYDGKDYGSPSAAATAVTGKAANGWRFWGIDR